MNISSRSYKLELLDGTTIEFHLLSAQTAESVFAAIQKFDDKPDYIEFLFNKLTKDKYDIETLFAGVPSLVIYSSLIKSGIIKDVESLISIIENSREDISSNVYFSIYSNICSVFPQYKLEELKEKTINELFELFAFTEKVAGKQLFDTAKMKASIDTPAGPAKKKGVASVTQDEIALLQSILSHEEISCGGMPNQGF